MVIRKEVPICNIKEDIMDFRKFSKYGHNFLMRYPDSFGQTRKKLACDPLYNISKHEIFVTHTFGVIAF